MKGDSALGLQRRKIKKEKRRKSSKKDSQEAMREDLNFKKQKL